jgi:hypothetical protein
MPRFSEDATGLVVLTTESDTGACTTAVSNHSLAQDYQDSTPLMTCLIYASSPIATEETPTLLLHEDNTNINSARL